MRQYPFCDKTCVNFGIKLDADNSIWMQSRFDGFDISDTLLVTHCNGGGKNSAGFILIH